MGEQALMVDVQNLPQELVLVRELSHLPVDERFNILEERLRELEWRLDRTCLRPAWWACELIGSLDGINIPNLFYISIAMFIVSRRQGVTYEHMNSLFGETAGQLESWLPGSKLPGSRLLRSGLPGSVVAVLLRSCCQRVPCRCRCGKNGTWPSDMKASAVEAREVGW